MDKQVRFGVVVITIAMCARLLRASEFESFRPFFCDRYFPFSQFCHFFFLETSQEWPEAAPPLSLKIIAGRTLNIGILKKSINQREVSQSLDFPPIFMQQFRVDNWEYAQSSSAKFGMKHQTIWEQLKVSYIHLSGAKILVNHRGVSQKKMSKTFCLTASQYGKNLRWGPVGFSESFWRCPFVGRKNFSKEQVGYHKEFVSQKYSWGALLVLRKAWVIEKLDA